MKNRDRAIFCGFSVVATGLRAELASVVSYCNPSSRRYALMIAAMTLGLLLGSCSKEPLGEIAGKPEGELITITFVPETLGDREASTRSLSNVNEDIVKDLWIIQLNATGTTRLVDPIYITDIASSGTNSMVRVYLLKESCRLYFIANTHNKNLYSNVTNDAGVKSKTMSVSGESNLASANGIPMSGYFSGTPSVANLQNITLTRAVSKLTVTLQTALKDGMSFTLSSVKVYNVPNQLQLFRDPSTLNPGTSSSATYPSTGTIGWRSSPFVSLTSGNISFSQNDGPRTCGWCYLPENARGTGTASSASDKTASTALGGASGQGNYATFVEVTGILKNNTFDESCSVTYKLYLGANEVSDYNVLRNTHYTLRIKLYGLSANDARVSYKIL